MSASHNDIPFICFGESFWSSRGMLAAGSPLKLACHLKRLGLQSFLVTRVGIDEEGKHLISFAEANRVTTDLFQLDYELPTGTITAAGKFAPEKRADFHLQAWDNIQWDPGFEKLPGARGFLVHGSLAARNEVSRRTFYRYLETGISRIFNLNLHASFYNRQVIEHCLRGTYLLKLTLEELELLTGWFGKVSGAADRMKLLQDRFSIPLILVSTGQQGCMLNVRGTMHEHPGFPPQNAGAATAEDAFLAGALLPLITGESPANIMGYACAMQALAAAGKMEFNYEPAMIHQLHLKI